MIPHSFRRIIYQNRNKISSEYKIKNRHYLLTRRIGFPVRTDGRINTFVIKNKTQLFSSFQAIPHFIIYLYSK